MPEEPYLLTEGPLPKSIYTYQLEDITRQLLNDRDFVFTKENNEDVITIDGNKYNWTEIIKYANLDHIDLNQNDFYLYSVYFPTVRMDNLKPKNETLYRNELYQDYYNKNQRMPDPEINFQEMRAINVYTGLDFYKKMNALLRGEFDFKQAKYITKDAIIQSVICASGLRKIPETTVKESYRGAKLPSPEELDGYIKAAKEHGVVSLSGFVSTSIKILNSDNAFDEKPLYFHFTNLKGIYVEPISACPSDKEFLMLPSQVQLTDYKFENGKHCFEGSMASDLASVKTGGMDIMDGLINDFLNKATVFIEQTKHIPKFNQTGAEIRMLSRYLKNNWSDTQTTNKDVNAFLNNSDRLFTVLNQVELNIDRKTGIRNLPILRELNKGIKAIRNIVTAIGEYQRGLIAYATDPQNVSFPALPARNEIFQKRSTRENISRIKEFKADLAQLKEGLNQIKQDFEKPSGPKKTT